MDHALEPAVSALVAHHEDKGNARSSLKVVLGHPIGLGLALWLSRRPQAEQLPRGRRQTGSRASAPPSLGASRLRDVGEGVGPEREIWGFLEFMQVIGKRLPAKRPLGLCALSATSA